MGGGEKAKIKFEQGSRKKKQRLFNTDNYKLTGPIRGTV
jgi:hypothetical protein